MSSEPTDSEEVETIPEAGRLVFEPFVLDLDGHRLLRQGVPRPVQDQPLRLLKLLAARSGELVRREEIRDYLWGEETYVDADQGIGYAVRTLRQALDDDAQAPRYIETVRGHGYRFIASVRHEEPDSRSDEPPVEVAPPAPPEMGMASPRRFPRRAIVVTVAALSLLALGLWLRGGDGRDARPAVSGAPVVQVGPLPEGGGAGNGALDEQVTARLLEPVPLPELTPVALRPGESAPDGAYRLRGVVTDDVDRLVITLDRPADGAVVWSGGYELDPPLPGVGTLPERIGLAARLALAAHVEDGSQAARERRAEARLRLERGAELLMAGDRSLNPADAEAAREDLERAVALDPSNALGWALLARMYLRSENSTERMHRALRHALALDETVPDGLAVLGRSLLVDHRQLPEARQVLTRAVELDPRAATPHGYLAVLEVFEGRFQEAVAEGQRALRLAPEDPRMLRDAMVVFFMSRRYDEALAVARQGRREVPEAFVFPFVEILATQLKGETDRAAELARRVLEERGRSVTADTASREVLDTFWRDQMERSPDWDRGVAPVSLMMLGRHDEALSALEREMRDDPGWIMWPYHLVSPVYEPVAATPRYRRLREVVYRSSGPAVPTGDQE